VTELLNPDRCAVYIFQLETERELTGLTPIVAQQILLGLSDADRSQFQEHMDDLLPALCDLICVEQCRDAKVIVNTTKELICPAQSVAIAGGRASSQSQDAHTVVAPGR